MAMASQIESMQYPKDTVSTSNEEDDEDQTEMAERLSFDEHLTQEMNVHKKLHDRFVSNINSENETLNEEEESNGTFNKDRTILLEVLQIVFALSVTPFRQGNNKQSVQQQQHSKSSFIPYSAPTEFSNVTIRFAS